MDTGLWYTHNQNFGCLSWFWRGEEHSCPLSPDLGFWRMLKVCDWGFASWYWFGYAHWSLVHQYSEFCLSILILKVQRTSMSFKSWIGALEDAGGSWLEFGILILIWTWFLVFDTPLFRIFAIYLDFEGAMNIHVLKSPDLGLWRKLEGPDWGLTSWSWFWYGLLSLICPRSNF